MSFKLGISTYTACISYDPLKDEIDPATAPLTFVTQLRNSRVPQDPCLDPVHIAEALNKQYLGESVCVLVPGQLFDVHGTRHGRGQGWYDRFLSYCNSSWLRIGITDNHHFTTKKILRKPWDKPVDVVYVYNSDSKRWSAYPAREYCL